MCSSRVEGDAQARYHGRRRRRKQKVLVLALGLKKLPGLDEELDEELY